LCDEEAEAEERVEHRENNIREEDCSTTTDEVNPSLNISVSSNDRGPCRSA